MKINILCFLALSLISTTCRENKSVITERVKISSPIPSADGKAVLSRVLRTNTGKSIVINETHPDGLSISRIEIIPIDFKDNQPVILDRTDPVYKVVLTDLDGNGFEELFIFTQSAGSGSAGTVYAYASDHDKKLVKIEFNPEGNKEIHKAGVYEGYMGHDNYYFEGGMLVREFPVYRANDSNVNPTGGIKRVYYKYKFNKLEFFKVLTGN
jgi:hypothetical protein